MSIIEAIIAAVVAGLIVTVTVAIGRRFWKQRESEIGRLAFNNFVGLIALGMLTLVAVVVCTRQTSRLELRLDNRLSGIADSLEDVGRNLHIMRQEVAGKQDVGLVLNLFGELHQPDDTLINKYREKINANRIEADSLQGYVPPFYKRVDGIELKSDHVVGAIGVRLPERPGEHESVVVRSVQAGTIVEHSIDSWYTKHLGVLEDSDNPPRYQLSVHHDNGDTMY